MKLRLECREAHRLAIERMDRRLSLVERAQLRLHLSVCDACTAIASQMHWLRGAMRRLGSDRDPR
jgi:hypothetical protein